MRIINSNPISLAETGAASRVAPLAPLTRPAALDFMMVAAVEDELISVVPSYTQ